MTEKRWTLEESENQDTIYDNEGLDDYYHLGNDTRDVKAICDVLNEYDKTVTYLTHKLNEYEILAKQMNLQTGSIAYLKILSLSYPNTVLHIAKDKQENGTVKIYVKKDCDELLLKSFMKNIPLGVKCKILAVTDVNTEIIKEEFQLD